MAESQPMPTHLSQQQAVHGHLRSLVQQSLRLHLYENARWLGERLLAFNPAEVGAQLRKYLRKDCTVHILLAADALGKPVTNAGKRDPAGHLLLAHKPSQPCLRRACGSKCVLLASAPGVVYSCGCETT
jgi:hypothetical protein